mmetsp:Transcript_28626/g.70859  ORF Transcript_28626/g.70859 Transcript_28626/m.70859 type:complete len:361 (-) Transcript_28626:169-1251(-)
MSIVDVIGSGQEQRKTHTGRKSQKPDFFSEALDWKIYRAARVPGPGHYDVVHDYKTMPGGRWGKSESGSFLDGLQRNAAKSPGPGQYDVDAALKTQDSGSSTGKFNMGQSKTYLDMVVYRSKNTPGPAEYHLPEAMQVHGGKFNMSNPKSDVDWRIMRAAAMPAPGQYGAGLIEKPVGGKFNTSKTRTEVDWAILRASRTPGPGQYSINEEASKRLRGGKFSNGNAKSDVDWQVHRAARTPGPGNYNVSRSENYLRSRPSISFAGRPGPSTMPAPFEQYSFQSTASSAFWSPAHSRAMSPESSLLRETGSTISLAQSRESLERSRVKTASHTERMKTAALAGAVKRRQRSTLGFGRSFFM